MAKKNLKYGVVRHKIYIHAAGERCFDTLDSAYPKIKKLFPSSKRKKLSRQKPNLTIKVPYQDNNIDDYNGPSD